MSWKSKSEEKRRMEKLYNLTGVSFWSGAFKNQYRNDTLTKEYPYSTNHPNVKKWWRRYSNRKYRRNKDELLNRCEHKKIFDLWWTLF